MMETEKELILVFDDGYKYTLSREEYHILKENCQLIRELEELTTEDDEDSSIIRIPKQHHGFENMVMQLKRKGKRNIKDCEFYVLWEMCLFFGCDTILYETIIEKLKLYDPNILNCLFVMYMCELFRGVPRSVYKKASRMISWYHADDVRKVLIPDAVRVSQTLKEIYGIHFITSDMLEADFWRDWQIRSLNEQIENAQDDDEEEDEEEVLNSFLKVDLVSSNTLECSYTYGKEYRWKHSVPKDIKFYMFISSKNDGIKDGILIIQEDNKMYKLIFEKLRLFYKHKIIRHRMKKPKRQYIVIDQEKIDCLFNSRGVFGVVDFIKSTHNVNVCKYIYKPQEILLILD